LSRQQGEWLPSDRINEPAQGVFFVEGPASNWIIVRDGSRFILIDGGYPADLELVLESVRYVGLEPRDATAMLVTHGHVDHTGSAAHFSRTYGTPALCSPEEVPHVRGEEKHQVTLGQVLLRAWRPRVFRWMRHALRAGALSAEPAKQARAWTPEELQKLPGSPEAVMVTAHTPGHCMYVLPKADAVATGDALITGHPTSARSGIQMLHPMFHTHPAAAIDALRPLAAIEASLILPGHGPATHEQFRDAIAKLTG